jgi:uncharacterized membrane protein SpoIIM required for sporulation
MREAAFVKLHSEKWKQFESLLLKKDVSPDTLADLFISITDDLAFAQTHYSESKTTIYLNNLASKVHLLIYQNKKENKKRIINFWKYELPLEIAKYQKYLIYSFLIFVISCGIGVISAANDGTFARLILGDNYINMTLANIEKGEPMGVYSSSSSEGMFLSITLNNIFVSFRAFAMGVFFSLGTGFILLQNGIMLGAFQYFFVQKGLFLTSFLSIWIHGTLEISAIIIAGAAGLVMGNSILFPGTYTRMASFKRGAKDGLKIIIGLIPIFIVAGFLESYVTRLFHLHWSIKLSIIVFSAFFIVYYFLIYPQKVKKNEP